MAFDLKKDWSTADVSSLLGSVEDDRSWRLEVTNDGLAQLNDLSTIPDAAYEERLHCYFEIWDQGTDFVGPGAASDFKPLQEDRACFAGELPSTRRPKNAIGALGLVEI